ncbi:MAG: YebC/PmpR family DNA-binding transcriptional regulator [Bacillota bacterium]|jgi:YebC/PmpR family DNA-binding regulatory protein|nr:YebC/PmpR family DNA-binding transcriptional regulator [Bacillota bacterium]NLL25888.1 YebC/PmpR family DNA-binding transcriptional regulator [Erysipelotrichia bacterium]
MGRAFQVRAASMAATAAKKTKIYSRFGKEIYMAAKGGVPDPEMNLNLKRVIDRAKAAQVPADIIKRNIERAKGGNTEAYMENRYEGFGPAGSTIIIDTLTDNSNRTLAEIRGCFNKAKMNLGQAGCVSYMYDHVGILSFEADVDEVLDILMLAEVNVIDVEIEDDGYITVYVDPADLFKSKDAIEQQKTETEFLILEHRMLPKEMVILTEKEDIDHFKRVLNLLDEVDDVQNIYHNVENIEEH